MKKFMNFVVVKDTKIFYLLNNRAKCNTLDKIMPYITHMGGTIFTVLLSLALIAYSKNYGILIGYEVALSLLISNIFAQVLKKAFARIRPFLALTNVNTFNFELKDYSFPSGHTTAAFSISIVLAIIYPQLTLLLLIAAFVVGFSRVYLGVHYPTDVLVGAIIGTLSAIVVHLWILSLILRHL